jgi:hypothetical protein
MIQRVAQDVVSALRGQPFALSLVIINILVLVGFGYTLREVGKSIERKDAMLQRCIGKGG